MRNRLGPEGAQDAAAHQALARRWALDDLGRRLRLLRPDIALEVQACVSSTNAVLLERCRQALSATGGASSVPTLLLVAEAQTHGRGRQGRSWVSHPGDSLTFSLAVPLPRDDLGGLSLAVGVAVADALDPWGAGRGTCGPGLGIGLKWPNDLMLTARAESGRDTGLGRKLAGVLIETVSVGRARAGVIGIGLNIRAPQSAGDGTAPSAWASLQALDPAATPEGALACIAPALLQALAAFEAAGFAGFADRFARRDVLAGREVCTHGQSARHGRALRVDAAGALQVQDHAGRVHAVVGGEVSVRAVRPGVAEEALPC